jgi:hypothetical protein
MKAEVKNELETILKNNLTYPYSKNPNNVKNYPLASTELNVSNLICGRVGIESVDKIAEIAKFIKSCNFEGKVTETEISKILDYVKLEIEQTKLYSDYNETYF